ncbi:hypothetical protein KX729_30615 [Rhizobium sp. XQZ8]|uniref:hypothetical protein n=1 Tax=Rhizobium populisoli TaxID=2859785 RepID=UPI001CA532A7|nr:hypothetical protein [Rhizobium populisoli]MBW6425748.1 hypothetical protein [Rhizobium populisoli]
MFDRLEWPPQRGSIVSANQTGEVLRIEALLLAFARLGRKQPKDDKDGALFGDNDLDRREASFSIISEAVDLSAHLDRDNPSLRMFSAAAIVASAVVKDPSYEKFLIEFSQCLIRLPDSGTQTSPNE